MRVLCSFLSPSSSLPAPVISFQSSVLSVPHPGDLLGLSFLDFCPRALSHSCFRVQLREDRPPRGANAARLLFTDLTAPGWTGDRGNQGHHFEAFCPWSSALEGR